jgi:predicted dehydrogenase
MAVGIYYETISRWVGPAKEVFAYKSQNVKERVDPESKTKKTVEIEDDVIITGGLKNGGSFNYHFGFANHTPSESIEIYGTDGTIVFHFDKDILQIAKRGEELKSFEIAPNMKKEWQVEHNFIQQIKTGKKQEATFEEGLAYMAFTQAISDSANQKKLISIS